MSDATKTKLIHIGIQNPQTPEVRLNIKHQKGNFEINKSKNTKKEKKKKTQMREHEGESRHTMHNKVLSLHHSP